jgi:hypothetical protein
VSSTSPEHGCERQGDCAAYVLGALTEHELEAYTTHLAGCSMCQAEVVQLQPVADLLAVGVPHVQADRGLRVRVLGAARAEVELGAGGLAVDAPAPASASRPSRVGGRSTASGRSTLRPVFPRRLLPGLAGALVLGVGLVVGALVFSSSSNVRAEVMPAAVVAPGHHAAAQLRKVGSHLELVVVGLPAPPPGRIYEVWLEHGTEPPLPTDALFSVTKTGSGSVGVPGNLHGVSKVLVTDEPLGGSIKPTRTPVIVGSV